MVETKELLSLLLGFVQELDFDEAEGHPPSDTEKELRARAREILKEAKRSE